jgi:hypothetical protein
MAQPSKQKAGLSKAKFGKTGKPVTVSTNKLRAAKAGSGRLYETGQYKPNRKGGK